MRRLLELIPAGKRGFHEIDGYLLADSAGYFDKYVLLPDFDDRERNSCYSCDLILCLLSRMT